MNDKLRNQIIKIDMNSKDLNFKIRKICIKPHSFFIFLRIQEEERMNLYPIMEQITINYGMNIR